MGRQNFFRGRPVRPIPPNWHKTALALAIAAVGITREREPSGLSKLTSSG